MNWKFFTSLLSKDLPSKEKLDESKFILGLDLGNDTSAIAYYEVNRLCPELIDISGGYGKPTIPTVLQYIPETREWVYGEYAVLNRGGGTETTVSGLIERLGRKEYVDIDNKPYRVTTLLGLFLKELAANCQNLNPKAEIVGIICAIPSYMTEEAQEELTLAFKSAGLEKELIGFAPDRECVFARHYFHKKPADETVLLLDYGSRDLRGGVYRVTGGDSIRLKSLSSLFDDNIGTEAINGAVVELLAECYRDNKLKKIIPPAEMEQIRAFAYQHRDLLFQKSLVSRPVKLYYNFTYPPFQQTFTAADAVRLLAPYREGFTAFLSRALAKNIYARRSIPFGDVDTVICTGGGFEMPWARQLVEDSFPDSQVVYYKNAKGVTAEGAAILAAGRMGVCKDKPYLTEDRHQVKADYGVKILSGKKERFVPIIEKNTFWWQTHAPKSFIINEKTEKPITLEIYTREGRAEQAEPALAASLSIEGLPSRPRGTTRLSVALQFEDYNAISATVKDCGFGELFPASDYEQTFSIPIAAPAEGYTP